MSEGDARGAAFPEDLFRHFCHDEGKDVMMKLDEDPKYWEWLMSTVPSRIGRDANDTATDFVPVWQMSASRAAVAGWRAVLQKDLEDKVRMLSASRAWSDAKEDRLILFLPRQIGAQGNLHFYLTGHHRGCALHAMLAFYFYCGSERGIEVPDWLCEMAMAIPADIADNVTTRMEVVSMGMARTLKMQHGTTKVFWIDIIVSLRQLEGSAGASPPSETAEKFGEALKNTYQLTMTRWLIGIVSKQYMNVCTLSALRLCCSSERPTVSETSHRIGFGRLGLFLNTGHHRGQ